jgi:receptor protein-tyrosine kinase
MAPVKAGNPLGALRRRGGLVLFPAVLAAAVALVLSLLSTSMYRATAEVVVATDAVSVAAEVAAATSPEVVSVVRQQIGSGPELSVEAASQEGVLDFTATSSNADNAAIAANTHAEVYAGARGGEVIQPASAPSSPYEPNTIRNTVLAFLAGLVIGIVAAIVVGRLDSTIRSRRRLQDVTGVPNLAVIPRVPLGQRRPDDLAAMGDPNSVEAEAYRTLRTAVEFLAQESGAKVILVTSPRPGEGKSSVAANLAVTAAQAGRNVVLIDGDLRKPQIHRSFGVRNDRGLSTVLTGECSLSKAVKRLDAEKNLVIVPAGPPPPNPAELLLSDRLGKAIEGLARAADLVFIDAPPVLPVTDSTILAQQCDAVLLAATFGLSDRREWAETIERLEVIKAPVMGTVLSRPDSRVEPTPTYHYAPTAAPANWWVTQATHAEQSARADGADPDEATTVISRNALDDLLWDESAPSKDPVSGDGARPSTGKSKDQYDHETRSDGSDGGGKDRRPDRRLERAGSSDGNGGDPADQTDADPLGQSDGGTLPPQAH